MSMLLFLNACTETDLDDQPAPQGQPKLVLTSFISPEEKGIRIVVSKSRPLFTSESSDTITVIENAIVMLSDGFTTVQIPYVPESGNFGPSIYADSNVVIEPGRTYTLKVTTPDGLAAEATCTVPTKVNTLVTARLDSSVTQPDSDVPDYIVETTWKDLPGTGDFYKASVFLKFKDPEPTADTSYFTNGMADDALGRDFEADGRTFTASSAPITYFRDMRNANLLHGFRIYLLTTDRHYYEYHRTLYRYQQNLFFEFESPVKIYSNVKGGLGIFAAYRSYQTDLNL